MCGRWSSPTAAFSAWRTSATPCPSWPALKRPGHLTESRRTLHTKKGPSPPLFFQRECQLSSTLPVRKETAMQEVRPPRFKRDDIVRSRSALHVEAVSDKGLPRADLLVPGRFHMDYVEVDAAPI